MSSVYYYYSINAHNSRTEHCRYADAPRISQNSLWGYSRCLYAEPVPFNNQFRFIKYFSLFILCTFDDLILNTKIPKSMASSSGSWTLAGGKKNKHQNSQSMSKTKKKAVIENMPRIEPNREFLNMLSQAVMLISARNARKRRQADQRCRHRRWLWPVVTMRAFNCLQRRSPLPLSLSVCCFFFASSF